MVARLNSKHLWALAFGLAFVPVAEIEASDPPDSTKKTVRQLAWLFSHGEFHGHLRTYGMSTLHETGSHPVFALATGARFHYHTASFKGFSMGLGGVFIFRVAGTELGEKDEISGALPRFERQLFDVTDPENHYELDRLDELYLHWHHKGFEITGGRFVLNTPFVNQQDTRMKPYASQGIDLGWKIPKINSWLQAGFLTHVSPRSTVNWYTVGESVGIYNTGVNPDGSPSNYAGNISSGGLGYLNVGHQWKGFRFDLWNYWFDRVSWSSYLQVTKAWRLGEKDWKLHAGVEGMAQFQLADGGNADPSKSYFPDQQVYLLGSRLGLTKGSWNMSLNSLHAFGPGRFTFPTEWGREQFFATLSRGRMEGLGQFHSLSLRAQKHLHPDWTIGVDLGHLSAPDFDDFSVNKYQQMSYFQSNLDITWKFHQFLEGLELRFLYVHKRAYDADCPKARLYYQADYHHFNLIAQIHF